MALAKTVVTIIVAFFVFMIAFPIAQYQIVAATNASLWDAAVNTIFMILLPVLAAIGVALKFIPGGGEK